MKFVSRPVTIEAVQWTGENATELTRFCKGAAEEHGAQERWWMRRHAVTSTYWKVATEDRPEFNDKAVTAALWVKANESWLPICDREWVAKDKHGLYPIKDDVFRAKYRREDDLNEPWIDLLNRHVQSPEVWAGEFVSWAATHPMHNRHLEHWFDYAMQVGANSAIDAVNRAEVVEDGGSGV